MKHLLRSALTSATLALAISGCFASAPSSDNRCQTQGDCHDNKLCINNVCATPTNGPLPAISSVAGNQSGDAQRIADGLVVTGSALDHANFELRQDASASPLTIRTQVATQAELVLPADVRQGAYRLAATNDSGSTDTGVTLTLPDLTADVLISRINTGATSTLGMAAMPPEVIAMQAQLAAMADKSCPPGYTHDTSRQDIVLCTRGADEMVQVGDFWVDRYEASVWAAAACTGTEYGTASDDYPSTFPDNGNVTIAANRLYACSVVGVIPSASLTWFQAAQACAASGKHLITNGEWQTAVAGTPDPGSWPTPQGATCTGDASTYHPRQCNTCSSGPAPTGDTDCVSLWGAEDMIGNMHEWTAEWQQAGSPVGGFTDGWATALAWPSTYGSDITANVNGRAAYGTSGYTDGLPAAALRGGVWASGTDAGAFEYYLGRGPSNWSTMTGFRCARR